MSNADGSRETCSDAQYLEIRVQGKLDARWNRSLEEMTFTQESGGITAITGPPMDQAALHGLLARIRDLGVPIVSLRRICPDDPAPAHNPEDEKPQEQSK